MEITINISKEDMKHLASPHTFYDECEEACIQLRKLQVEINKKLKMDNIPSKEKKEYWIKSKRKKTDYPLSGENCGKWLIFIKKGEDLDTTWLKIKELTENGLLGSASKVSTNKDNKNSNNKDMRVICVYPYDSNDLKDLNRIATQLFTIDIINKIYYKEDNLTYLGVYANQGNKNISKYIVTRKNINRVLK